MPNVNIEDKLYEEIREYCRLNKLTISVFVNNLLRKEFMVEKYDDAPPFFKKKEKEIVSIPVETEKEPAEVVVDDETNTVHVKLTNTIDKIETKITVSKEGDVQIDGEEPGQNVQIENKKEEELSPKEKARRRVQYL